jgi:tRNA (mo5U34)-methyltransferase
MNPSPDVANAGARARELVDAYPNWYHRIEVVPGLVTPGINDSSRSLEALNLPGDLRGATVLDIGTRDGFFAFESERRGADVLAVDYLPATATGFSIAAGLLGSRVRYLQENIYNLRPEAIGTFDVVLMLGLLYHLPDPIRAFSTIRKLCRSELYLETHVADDDYPELASLPVALFCPGMALNADPTNYWAPTTPCVEAMLVECGFAVESVTRLGNRSIVKARIASDEHRYYRTIAHGEQLPLR